MIGTWPAALSCRSDAVDRAHYCLIITFVPLPTPSKSHTPTNLLRWFKHSHVAEHQGKWLGRTLSDNYFICVLAFSSSIVYASTRGNQYNCLTIRTHWIKLDKYRQDNILLLSNVVNNAHKINCNFAWWPVIELLKWRGEFWVWIWKRR